MSLLRALFDIIGVVAPRTFSNSVTRKEWPTAVLKTILHTQLKLIWQRGHFQAFYNRSDYPIGYCRRNCTELSSNKIMMQRAEQLEGPVKNPFNNLVHSIAFEIVTKSSSAHNDLFADTVNENWMQVSWTRSECSNMDVT